MSCFTQFCTAFALAVPVTLCSAAPAYFITHNNTDYESNAYVDGTRPSPNPSKAHATNKVPWIVVQMACLGKASTGKCTAVIKMETNTANPVTLGTVELTLENGAIHPDYIAANGYIMIVNGPGEVTLERMIR